jgi:hypothetical protein
MMETSKVKNETQLVNPDVAKKSSNEKEVNLIDSELKQLVTIIKPTRNSKIYEKFE